MYEEVERLEEGLKLIKARTALWLRRPAQESVPIMKLCMINEGYSRKMWTSRKAQDLVILTALKNTPGAIVFILYKHLCQEGKQILTHAWVLHLK